MTDSASQADSPPAPGSFAASSDSRQRQRRRRTVRRWLGRIVLAIVAVGVVAGVVWAFLPKPVMAELARAERGPLEVVVEDRGATRIRERHVVAAPVAGTLRRITLDAGDVVEEGGRVALIDAMTPAPLDARSRREIESQLAAAQAGERRARAATEQARIAAEQADRDLERQRSLAAKKAVTAQALEQAEAAARLRHADLSIAKESIHVAASEAARARAMLGTGGAGADGTAVAVNAPIGGVVLRVLRESEGPVVPGAPLVELGDPAQLEVVADVLSSDAVDIHPGDPVRVVRWGGEGALAGTVRLVEPAARTVISALGVEEQRVDVHIDLTEPRERWLRLGDGYRVEVEIVVWRADDVLSVPSSAVFQSDSGHAVYRVEDGRAHLRTVTVGHESGVASEITAGLEAGDVVVVQPGDQIAEGVRVSE